jgi:hypothetical protein
MSTSTVFRSTALAAACTVLTAALPRSSSAQTERRTVSGNDVAIYNLAGEITVEPGSGSDIIVVVRRGGRDADRLRVDVGQLRGRNTLRVVYPDADVVYPGASGNRGREWGSSSSTEMSVDDDGTWGDGNRWNDRRRKRVKTSGDGTEAWADLRILVPSGKSLDVNLGAGRLDANAVRADLRLDVSAARLSVSGTRGNLVIDAGSGDVELRDIDARTLKVDNGSGGITFANLTGGTCSIDTGSGGVRGDRIECDNVKVSTGSGSVPLGDVRSDDTDVDTGSGGVRMDLLSAPRSLRIDAGSGGVTLSMPANTSAEVDIETGSGGIETDFGLQTDRYQRNRLRGRIGNGSGRISIETGSGSVRLLKRTGSDR